MPVTFIDITDPQDVGQRLDNYLMRVLKGVPKQHIYRIVRKGEVRVNGGRIKADYRLKQADKIRVPPIRTRDELPVQVSAAMAERLRTCILYEDDDFLLLNKPSGLAVHGGSGLAAGIIEMLRTLSGNKRLELVHRLDRDTSGCLALAKNRAALQAAQKQFRERQVKKVYEAIVHGAWPTSQRVVQKKLKRYETKAGERRVRVDAQGQSARTDFAVLERAGDVATHMQATLHTGRTHQIRVHTLSVGHPIVGDDKYSLPDQQTAQAKTERAAVRLCLHASKLAIPIGQDVLKVHAPLDPEITAIWLGLVAQSKAL